MSFDVYVVTRRPVDDDLMVMAARVAGLVFDGRSRPDEDARIERPGPAAEGFDVVELPAEDHADLPGKLADLVPEPAWMGLAQAAYGSGVYQEMADFCVALAGEADGVAYDPQGDRLLWPKGLPRRQWAEGRTTSFVMRARGWAEAARQRVRR